MGRCACKCAANIAEYVDDRCRRTSVWEGSQARVKERRTTDFSENSLLWPKVDYVYKPTMFRMKRIFRIMFLMTRVYGLQLSIKKTNTTLMQKTVKATEFHKLCKMMFLL